MTILQRWAEYRRQYGIVGLARHLFARVVRPVWESSSLQLLVLTEPVAPIKAKVEIRIARMTATEAHVEGIWQPDWDKRWDRGEVCYSAWQDQTCVHYSWLTDKNAVIGEIHQALALSANQVYIYDCFTDGRFRGLRIFPAVLSAIAESAFGEGICCLWIAVETSNRSSIHAIERAGFTPAAEVCFRRVGPWKTTRIRSVVTDPCVHLIPL